MTALAWRLLVAQLPAHPSSARVQLWRHLRADVSGPALHVCFRRASDASHGDYGDKQLPVTVADLKGGLTLNGNLAARPILPGPE